MDPTANLQNQLNIAKAMLDPDSRQIDTGDAIELAELVLALHEWLAEGGFLPDQWQKRVA